MTPLDSYPHRFTEQQVVQYDHCRHCFYYGYGTGQHAGVVTSAGRKRRLVAVNVYGLLFAEQRSHRLEGHAELDVLSVGDAALYASAMVALCGKSFLPDVILLTAALGHSGKALAVLKALHGIDAQHGGS